jgi:hypothetical protein
MWRFTTVKRAETPISDPQGLVTIRAPFGILDFLVDLLNGHRNNRNAAEIRRNSQDTGERPAEQAYRRRFVANGSSTGMRDDPGGLRN